MTIDFEPSNKQQEERKQGGPSENDKSPAEPTTSEFGLFQMTQRPTESQALGENNPED